MKPSCCSHIGIQSIKQIVNYTLSSSGIQLDEILIILERGITSLLILQMPDGENIVRVENSLVKSIYWKRDGWRAWIVCSASFYVFAVTWGTTSCFPMLLPYLVDLYKYSNASDASSEDRLVLTKTSMVYSVNNGLAYLASFPAAFLVDRIGCRLTFLLGVALSVGGNAVAAVCPDGSLWIWWLGHGVANGTGVSLTYFVSSVVLEQVFARHYGAASSIMSVGTSFAFLTIPLLWNFLLRIGRQIKGPDKLEGTSTGMSLVMFSVVASQLILVLMLPLFGSPFFIAARSHVRNLNSSTSNKQSSESTAQKSLHRASKLMLYTKRLVYFLFDIPVPSFKYSNSLQDNGSTNSLSSGTHSQFKLLLKLLLDWNFIIYIIWSMLLLIFSGAPDTFLITAAEEIFPDSSDVGSKMLVSYGIAQIAGKFLAARLLDWFPSLIGNTLIVATGTLFWISRFPTL